jgi:hypothetical protein
MANLLNQNIGTNYKGILNLNTLNGNLTTTLQAVTDGMGNASPLQLSTTQVGLNYSGNNTLLNLNTQASVAGGLRITYASSATEGLEFLYNSAGATISNINSIYASNSAELRFNMQTAAGGIRAMTIFGTGQIAINTTSASAQLQVRGDGTNPIARFQSNAGTDLLIINEGGAANISFGSALSLIGNTGTSTFSSLIAGNVTGNVGTLPVYSFNMNADTSTSSTSNYFSLSKSITPSAGSANFRNLIIDYTINASGAQTGTATGIFLNATETALNGMGHNLMDLQVGGVSKFRVSNSGTLTIPNNNIIVSNGYVSSSQLYALTIGKVGNYFIDSASDGVVRISDNAQTSFNRLQLGGTTNAFPAIKRNGAGIDFRLADDSGYCAISATSFTIGGTATSLSANSLNLAGFNCMFYSSRIYIDNDNRGVAINNNLAVGGGNVATNASAALEVISTTKGFLPPRMTTTQKNAISTPASGLVVYDSTLNKLAVYTGSAWETVTSI